MKRTLIYSLTILFILIVFGSCYHKPSTQKTKLSVIKFDNHLYPKTDPAKIIIYTARKDITKKYIEIGTIKYERINNIENLRKLAGENGADALILEGNNYILIIFQENKKDEQQNNYKSI